MFRWLDPLSIQKLVLLSRMKPLDLNWIENKLCTTHQSFLISNHWKHQRGFFSKSNFEPGKSSRQTLKRRSILQNRADLQNWIIFVSKKMPSHLSLKIRDFSGLSSFLISCPEVFPLIYEKLETRLNLWCHSWFLKHF